MGTFATIPFNKLTLSEANIRKSATSPEADAELKASIEAAGVLLNLIVSKGKNGKRVVEAGGRRYRAVAELVKEKKFPRTYPVPCYTLDANENAEQAALIENTLREDMHPIDEYEAYSRLHFVHQVPIEKIAAQFGTTSLEVQKRLKLGNVAPELRQMCRDGELALDALAAFTAIDTPEKQLECYEAVKKRTHGGHVPAWMVREQINDTGYRSDDKVIRLIDLDEYAARGGTCSTDLFASVKYFHNRELVEELVKERLATEVQALLDEGWKWADVSLDFYNKPNPYPKILDPVPTPEDEIPAELKARQQELTEKIHALEQTLNDAGDETDDETFERLEEEKGEAEDALSQVNHEIEMLDKYSDEQKAVSGCVIYVDHNGQIEILRGRVRKEDVKNAAKAAEADNIGTDAGSTSEPDGSAEEELPNLSQALTQDLNRWRMIGLKLDLYYNAELANDLVDFAVICRTLIPAIHGRWSGFTVPVSLHVDEVSTGTGIEDERATQTLRELESICGALNLDWYDPEDAVASWNNFRESCHTLGKERMKLRACCAALMLTNPEDDFYRCLINDMGTVMGKYWRPTAKNYFDRAPKPVLLQNGAEIFDDDEFAHRHRAKNKGELAALLDERMAQEPGPDVWVPSLMR